LTATDAGVPVVPIAIRGTRSILRDGSWLPRRGSISVTIGKPIEPKAIKAHGEADSWAIAMRLCDAAREHILCHCGEPDLAHEKSPLMGSSDRAAGKGVSPERWQRGSE
jgi:1-acyl-sn-glycerol-3-phosphate acyltransferase